MGGPSTGHASSRNTAMRTRRRFRFMTDTHRSAAGTLLHRLYHRAKRTRYCRESIARSPLYSGQIEGIGPRYCPSIEDKFVKFPDKDRHQIFLEPEGLDTNEVYVNGMSTSMPIDVQAAMIASIPGLEDAEMIRPGLCHRVRRNRPAGAEAQLEVKSIEDCSSLARSTAPPAMKKRRARDQSRASTPPARSRARSRLRSRDRRLHRHPDRRSHDQRRRRAVSHVHLARRVPAAPPQWIMSDERLTAIGTARGPRGDGRLGDVPAQAGSKAKLTSPR